MKAFISSSRQLTGLLVLLSVASLFLLCVSTASMPMNAMGQVSPCGMSHNPDLCPMTLSSRFSFWQSLTVPMSTSFDAFALLAFLAALAFFWNSAAIFEAIHSKLKSIFAWGSPSLFDYLQQLFSHGILHPKIY